MATGIEAVFSLITLCGLAYLLLALWSARSFHRSRLTLNNNAPAVSILKPLKGVDPRMYAGFASHCQQEYAGQVEILFGVGGLDDPAVSEIERLQREFPTRAVRIIVCPERLGASGKVSTLVQLEREARHPYLLINDSDILVSPSYLARVMAPFADEGTGMVTAPYIGHATADSNGRIPVWSKLEALGISTDFMPGVLTARFLERGLRFGLGSTLAMRRDALGKAGGLLPLADHLADDYELGKRIAAAGYKVELCPEIVETTVPAYTFRGFRDHQLRWARSTRDSRRLGYVGLGITYPLLWAVATCVASGFALWSFSLLSLVLLVRVAVALSVGVGLLRDGQVLRDLWLLPARDLCGLFFWAWSFAGDTVVWRGERFQLTHGRIAPVARSMRPALVLLSLSLIVSSTMYGQAGDSWSRVQQLAPGTAVKVSAKGGGGCTVQSVSADSLVCAHGSSTRSIARGDIKSIKLARRGHSTLVGLALGAGIGVGAGVGIGEAINSSNKGNLLYVTTSKAAGVGAAIGGILGTATGGIVGYTTNLFGGPVIYKR